jgi:hypothetical protein
MPFLAEILSKGFLDLRVVKRLTADGLSCRDLLIRQLPSAPINRRGRIEWIVWIEILGFSAVREEHNQSPRSEYA